MSINKRKSTSKTSNNRKRFKNENCLSSIVNIDDETQKIVDELKINLFSINKSPSDQSINFLMKIKEKNTIEKLVTNSSTSTSITEQLKILNLQTINIIGDGNCFFRAISHQLFDQQNHYRELRNLSIMYMNQNKSIFKSFVTEDKNINNYISRMSKNNTYADHLIITATAIALNQNIVIHEQGKRPLLIPGSDYIDHQLHILYNVNLTHYDSLKDFNGNTPFINFIDLQNT